MKKNNTLSILFSAFINTSFHKLVCHETWSHKRMRSLTKIGIEYGFGQNRLKSYQDRFKIHEYAVNVLNGNQIYLCIWKIIFLTKLFFLKA